MRVLATNAIWDFRVNNDEIHFVKLKKYEEYESEERKIDAIVLLCERILSVRGIEMLDVITNIVKTFPKDIPCYLIGIKSNIKNTDYLSFKHEDRDTSVRMFIEEILKRSESIGVCDELTRKWLTEYFGFDLIKVDLIIDEEKKRDRRKLVNFLEKNKLDYLRDPYALREILRFHNDRGMVCNDYLKKQCKELGEKIEKEIVITAPELIAIDNKCRLSSNILIDGEIRNIWVETDVEYKGYFDLKTCDAFLIAVLPFAIRTDHDIRCEIPVSEELFHNIAEELIPNLCAGDCRFYKSKIIAETVCVTNSGHAVGVGFSGGVDSFYSLYHYMEGNYKNFRPTHLFIGNYGLNDAMMAAVYHRADKVAKEAGLKTIKTNTNISAAFPELIHLFVHFFKIFFGVVALRDLFKTYIYSTTYMANLFSVDQCGTKDTAYYELLLVRCFEIQGFKIIDGGGDVEREEKTAALIKYPISYDTLNVCVKPQLEKNCGVCGKCLRTLLTLDSLNALDLYRGAFDIDKYKKNRMENLKYMVEHKDNRFILPIYKKMCIMEPDLIKQIES